jgi:hypothetical protein
MLLNLKNKLKMTNWLLIIGIICLVLVIISNRAYRKKKIIFGTFVGTLTSFFMGISVFVIGLIAELWMIYYIFMAIFAFYSSISTFGTVVMLNSGRKDYRRMIKSSYVCLILYLLMVIFTYIPI